MKFTPSLHPTSPVQLRAWERLVAYGFYTFVNK